MLRQSKLTFIQQATIFNRHSYSLLQADEHAGEGLTLNVYKPNWLVICKRLEMSSKTYISFVPSDFQRQWSLSTLSERLELFLTAEVAPPDLKL